MHAADLLANTCTSCLSLTSSDGYTATLSLRVLDLYLADQTFIFNITIYLSKYHSNGTIGEPSVSIDFYVNTFRPSTCINSESLASAVVINNST